MADDRHYVGGEWYRICDRTGFKVRAPHTQKEWTNRIIRKESWEPRQPQDFVQGIADDQSVDEPRPRQLDQFQGPLGTKLTASYPAGAVVVNVQSSVRMVIGDILHVMMDNGENLTTSVAAIFTDTQIQIFPGLSFKASSGNVVIDTSAVSTPTVLATSGVGL